MFDSFGNGGAFGRNVGTLPAGGVDCKVRVGEETSLETITDRGTAVGFVERSDTEGAGRVVVGEEVGNEEVGNEEDWAAAKREDKRMVRIANWNIDVDIVKDAQD